MKGKKIGDGNTAEVFLYDETKVLKLLRPGRSESIARNEYERAKFVAPFPFPKAMVYEYVNVENRPGIIYEKIDGISLEQWVFETRDLEGCANYLARLHEKMLCCKFPEAQGESYKDILYTFIGQAGVSEEEKRNAKNLLNRLPEGNCLCHGDYHPGNVIIQNGKTTVIDFLNICRGPRLYDIARTVYLVQYTPVPQNCDNPEELQLLREKLSSLYLEKMKVRWEEIQPYLEVIQVARKGECPEE